MHVIRDQRGARTGTEERFPVAAIAWGPWTPNLDRSLPTTLDLDEKSKTVTSRMSEDTYDDENMATASIQGSTWSFNSAGDISQFIKEENGRVSAPSLYES